MVRKTQPKMVRVLTLLPPEQLEALRQMSREKRRPVTDLIREAIERYTGVPDPRWR
mgnify:FL=1